MGLLQSLLGGGQQRDDAQNFVDRYHQGAPYQSISNQEALSRYQQVAPQLPPQQYQMSAEEAFSRMSPQERQAFAQYMQQQAQAQNIPIPDMNQNGVDDRMEDPRALAQYTTQIHQQDPGLMGRIMGGNGEQQVLDNPMAKVALAGIAAIGLRHLMGGGGGIGGGSPF